jgi:hypothetical protein
MPEIPSYALLLASRHTDAPFKKHLKILIRTIFKLMPLLLNKSFKVRKELFDRVEVRRVGRQVQKLDAYLSTHLLDSFSMVERYIVYHEDRIRLRKGSTVVEQLFDEVLKDSTVSYSPEHAGEKYTILCVRRQYLIALLTLIPSYLD